MSQSDFASLAVQFDEGRDSNSSEVGNKSDKKQSAGMALANDLDQPSIDVYAPTNFIPDEVIALIATWEASYSVEMSKPNNMIFYEKSVPLSQYTCDSSRCRDSSPPKRFYRTFWISAARRILSLASMQTLNNDLDLRIAPVAK